MSDPLAQFRDKVVAMWLPTYCGDPKRNYDPAGFRSSSISVSEIDAVDCLYAIDRHVVIDRGGGRYEAEMSTAFEPLFWEGRRDKSPRPITLWLEPVITFAALARLHRDHGWPIALLGTQPRSWAFDLAAHEPSLPTSYRILGEVKKTVRETDSLLADLRRLAAGDDEASVADNSLKKWKGLLVAKPSVVWLVGPSGYSKVLAAVYPSADCALLSETTPTALDYSDAAGVSDPRTAV